MGWVPVRYCGVFNFWKHSKMKKSLTFQDNALAKDEGIFAEPFAVFVQVSKY